MSIPPFGASYATITGDMQIDVCRVVGWLRLHSNGTTNFRSRCCEAAYGFLCKAKFEQRREKTRGAVAPRVVI
jgi:hypothetical protein